MAIPWFSKRSKYCFMVDQSRSTPASSRIGIVSLRSSLRVSFNGAAELPQFPTTSVVIPCLTLLSALELTSKVKSE